MKAAFASAARLGWICVTLLLLCAATAKSPAAELKLEAQLILGSKDAKSPDPSYKPVDAEVAKKLKSLPLKWSNYFVVSTKQFSVAQDKESQQSLGQGCEVKVKNLGKSQVEVTLYGKNGALGKTTQALPKGQLFVTGANEANLFVVLKQVD